MDEVKKDMTEREISKLDIAREYLDAAIEFFLPETNLFCAIHLAGAAEELFGPHFPECQRIYTSAVKAEMALKSEVGRDLSDARKRVNEWRNEVKHMSGGASRSWAIDPEFAAKHHIEQALVNFYKLGLQKLAAPRRPTNFTSDQSPRSQSG